jgi:DNA repair and recombination protein RAD54B
MRRSQAPSAWRAPFAQQHPAAPPGGGAGGGGAAAAAAASAPPTAGADEENNQPADGAANPTDPASSPTPLALPAAKRLKPLGGGGLRPFSVPRPAGAGGAGLAAATATAAARPPLLPTPQQQQQQPTTAEQRQHEQHRHFAVLFTKRDKWKKKSGRQFSDGVLKLTVAAAAAAAAGGGARAGASGAGGSSSAASYVLYDGEGKAVGQGKGLKLGSGGLAGLEPGAVLELGTFVAELDRSVAAEAFLSGACFAAASAGAGAAAAGGLLEAGGGGAGGAMLGGGGGGGFKRPGLMAGGARPPLGGAVAGAGRAAAGPAPPAAPPQAYPPLHDPRAPAALVLNQAELDAWARRPAPPARAQQQQLQQQQRPPTPVVLDPYLARRLQPHQRDGVRFLYEATMGLRGAGGAAAGGGAGGGAGAAGGGAASSSSSSSSSSSTATGALLADEMGLGKTLQIIALVWTLLRQSPRGQQNAQGGAIRKAIVVAPATLTANWAAEVRKWLGDERLRVMVLSPTGSVAQSQAQDFATRGSLWKMAVVSYEGARRHAKLLAGCADLLVCDEAHRLKCAQGSKTLDALNSLGCSKRVALSGTPFQNNMSELYALVDFACPGLLGPLPAFRRVFADPITRSEDGEATQQERELGAARSAELRARVRPWVLRRTQAVLAEHLPPLRVLVAFCAPTELQRACYAHVLRGRGVTGVLRGGGGGGGGGGEDVLPAITVLRKLCNAPELLLTAAAAAAGGGEAGGAAAGGGAAAAAASPAASAVAREAAAVAAREMARLRGEGQQQQPAGATADPHHSGKLTVLEVLLERVLGAGGGGGGGGHGAAAAGAANGHGNGGRAGRDSSSPPASSLSRSRAVVVADSTAALDCIELRVLQPRGWRSARIDGSTPPEQRQEHVDAFNRHGHGDVFLLSTQAGGAGLNLTGANTLVLYSSCWNPALDLQAMARVWRLGQTKPCTVYRLLTAGTVEEMIYQRQLLKQAVGRGAISGGGGGGGGGAGLEDEGREDAGPAAGEDGGPGAGAGGGGDGPRGLSREELRRMFSFEPDAPGGCTSKARLEGYRGLRWFADDDAGGGGGGAAGAAGGAGAAAAGGGEPMPPALAAAWKQGLVTAAHEELRHGAAQARARAVVVKQEPGVGEEEEEQEEGGDGGSGGGGGGGGGGEDAPLACAAAAADAADVADDEDEEDGVGALEVEDGGDD